MLRASMRHNGDCLLGPNGRMSGYRWLCTRGFAVWLVGAHSVEDFAGVQVFRVEEVRKYKNQFGVHLSEDCDREGARAMMSMGNRGRKWATFETILSAIRCQLLGTTRVVGLHGEFHLCHDCMEPVFGLADVQGNMMQPLGNVCEGRVFGPLEMFTDAE